MQTFTFIAFLVALVVACIEAYLTKSLAAVWRIAITLGFILLFCLEAERAITF